MPHTTTAPTPSQDISGKGKGKEKTKKRTYFPTHPNTIFSLLG